MLSSDRRHFLRLTGLSMLAGASMARAAARGSGASPVTPIRFPGPLEPGDVIGVTSPSAGVKPGFGPRMRYAYRTLERMGYTIREGQCLWGRGLLSAPAAQRAEELQQMLLDPSLGVVFPPDGGELLIDILPLIDFERLARGEPKWLIGYSDLSTFMLPYTLRTGIATLSGTNLWECPIRPTDPNLAWWHDVARLAPGEGFVQWAARRYQPHDTDWPNLPANIRHFDRTRRVRWQCLGHEDDLDFTLAVSGRLLGGTLDVIGMLCGSEYGEVTGFAERHAPEGLLIYLDNCDYNTAQYCRALHQLKLAGWFRRANAVLIGRTAARSVEGFTQRDALLDALGDLGVPVIYDMDIGHLPPQLMLVNGASATLRFGPGEKSLAQILG